MCVVSSKFLTQSFIKYKLMREKFWEPSTKAKSWLKIHSRNKLRTWKGRRTKRHSHLLFINTCADFILVPSVCHKSWLKILSRNGFSCEKVIMWFASINFITIHASLFTSVEPWTKTKLRLKCFHLVGFYHMVEKEIKINSNVKSEKINLVV